MAVFCFIHANAVQNVVNFGANKASVYKQL